MKELENIEPDTDNEAKSYIVQDAIYNTNIPKSRQDESNDKDIKRMEPGKLDQSDAYKKTDQEGQKAENFREGKNMIKAEPVVRKDQEDTTNINIEFPTVRRGNTNMFLLIMTKKLIVKSQDIASACPLYSPIEKEVYVKLPKSRRIPGVTHGSVDTSKEIYDNSSKTSVNLGCRKLILKPAMIICYKNYHNFTEESLRTAVIHINSSMGMG